MSVQALAEELRVADAGRVLGWGFSGLFEAAMRQRSKSFGSAQSR